VEAAVALFVCRIGFALAGLGVALFALYRANRRIDIPNQVHAEITKLKADLRSVTTSVEQTIGAYEDRLNRWQKGVAGQAGGRPRKSEKDGNGDGQLEQAPAEAPMDVQTFRDPRRMRAAIRNARLGRGG
jgi:hypothetical protein